MLALVVLFVAVAMLASAQGLFTETKTSGGPLGDKTFTGQTYYMPKMFKNISAQTGVMIFRLDKQKIYEVNDADKTYAEITFDEWEAAMKKAAAKTDAAMGDLQKKLEGMPKEQREMLEKMMGDKAKGSGGGKIEVKPTSDKKTVCGLSATKVIVQQDGKDMLTLWVSKDLIGISTLKKDYEDFSRRMLAASPGGMRNLADAFAKIDGYPVSTEVMGVTTEAVKIEKKSIASSEFEVPSGYKKVPSKILAQIDSTPEK
jgi:hypothetical protein